MAEYIERTEDLMLAMNAGARAIENTKRYHGAVYTKDVFSESPQEIPYLLAAKVLREASDAPAADVAPVVRCRDCINAEPLERNCEVNANVYMHCRLWRGEECKNVWHKYKRYYRDYSLVQHDDFCSSGERKDGAEC